MNRRKQGLSQALRGRALDEAYRMYVSSRDASKTIDVIEKHLQDPYIQIDPLYLSEIVRYACLLGQLDQASDYIRMLTFVEPAGSPLIAQAAEMLQRAQADSESAEKRNSVQNQ